MTEFRIVQRFIDEAANARDTHHLKAILSTATGMLGFDYFALVHHVDLRRAPAAGMVALWTYPEQWVEEYLERRLATGDPVHLASHRTNVGFVWDRIPQLITITPAHRRVRERTRRAGIGEGFTVPANIPGEANGSCSFAMAGSRAFACDYRRGAARPRAMLRAGAVLRWPVLWPHHEALRATPLPARLVR